MTFWTLGEANVRPWKLAEVNYAYIKEHPYEVAVLPLRSDRAA